MANLTLDGAQRHLEKLKERQVKRVGVETLRAWEAIVEWFSGNRAESIRQRLMWEPGRSFGKLLPLPMGERPREWALMLRLAVSMLVEEPLERGLDKEKLKSRKYLGEVLQSAANIIKEAADWPPIVVHDGSTMNGIRFYHFHFPGAPGRDEKYSIYPDGKVYRDGEYNPNTQNFDREEVSPDVLEQILDRCIQ